MKRRDIIAFCRCFLQGASTLALTASVFTFVFFPVTTSHLLAQSPPYPQKFEHLSLEHGLSHESVYSIVQDDQGFMWFGTEDGLNKFDGYNITILRHDPLNPNSLSSSNFGKIYIDGSGIMWFGTWGGGLNRYDTKTHTFKHFLYDPQDPYSLSQNRVEFVYRDRSGRLWVGTEGGGLNRFDEANERFIHYRHHGDDPTGLSNDLVKAICEDDNGRIWIGTNRGLNLWDPGTDTFTHYFHEPGNESSLSSNRIRAVFQDKKGNMWIGTRGGGLNRFNLNTGTFTWYKNNPDDPHSISDNSITQMFEDSRGILWIGTYNGGLNRFDPVKEIFFHYKYDPRDPHSLSHNRVEVIFEDRSQVLWLGTRGGGINKMDLKPAKFKNYTYNPHLPRANSLPHPGVVAIAGGPDEDTTWIGTDGKGITLLNHKKNRFKYLRDDAASPNPLRGSRAWALLAEKNGNLWIGTYSRGLYKMTRIDDDRYDFTHYRHDPDNPASISGNRIQVLFEDKDGDIWVGTNQGLNLLVLSTSRNNSKFKRFRLNAHKPNCISSDYVSAICQDDSGKIWIGTDNGLNRLDKHTGDFTCYKNDPTDPKSIGNNNVHVLYESPAETAKGVFWVGTEDGLSRFHRNTQTFKNYMESHGLAANRIAGILADDRGYLWISTSRGLSRFDPAGETFKNYYTSDGLPGHGFSRNACFKNSKSEMFFGGTGGLTVFSPRRVKDNPFIPPLVLTSFKIFNKDAALQPTISRIKEMTLSYKENFISVEFAALDYTNPYRNRYAYKMAGIDRDWVYCGSRRFASYPNLAPGVYTFRVKGSNNDGVWNEEGVMLKLIITPPFWETWWFRGLIVLVLVISVFIAFRLRVHHIEKRNKELKEANTRLEEQIKKRHQVEEALLESKRRLHSVIDHIPLVIWAVDRDGIFTVSEGRGLDLLGLNPGEVVGQSVFDVYAEQPEIVNAVRRALEGETFSSTIFLGGLVFESRFSPLKDRDGQVTGATGVAIDETEHQRAEQEKRNLEEQLRHVQKLETIGTLAGGIAHDFNNILGPVVGYTEMALEEVSHNQVVCNWLESVMEAANRAKELVQQILVFGRRDKQEYKPLLVHVVVKEALRLTRASFPTTIEIRQYIYTDCEPVLADASQIHQVLMNLCANAKHAMMEKGGILEVRLKMKDVDDNLARAHPNLSTGRYVLLTVGDTGHGMDQETKERLFEPFFTTKKPGEGTGMGLAVVHGIIMAHGGAITVSSELGKGTEFNVYLPVSGHVHAPAVDSRKSLPIPRGSEHVLFVDDEKTMTVMGKTMLEQLGYRVTDVNRSDEALNFIKQEPRQFDIVITDQTMPHLTGIDLTKKIKMIRPDLPVIIISGFSEIVSQDNIKKYGAAAYIPKPFNSRTLGTITRQVLDHKPNL